MSTCWKIVEFKNHTMVSIFFTVKKKNLNNLFVKEKQFCKKNQNGLNLSFMIEFLTNENVSNVNFSKIEHYSNY